MLQSERIPNIVPMWQVKINSSGKYDNIINPHVIYCSPNEEFLVLLYHFDFLLIDSNSKILLHMFYLDYFFQFSPDSKYLAIQFVNEEDIEKFMLYKLEQRTVMWVKEFKYQSLNKFDFIFFENTLIITDQMKLKVMSLEGVITETQFKHKNILSSNLTYLFQEYIYLNYSYNGFRSCYIINGKNYKIIKLFCSRYEKCEIVKLQKLILFEQVQYCVREIINGKILRKMSICSLQPMKSLSCSIINQELFLIKQQHFYIVNFYTGFTYFNKFDFPFQIYDITMSLVFIRDPVFFQCLKSKKTKQNRIKAVLQFYKFDI